MIRIHINGQAQQVAVDCPLTDVIERVVDQDKKFAVAINQTFVPRQAYAATVLSDGDHLEIVSPIQGG